MKKILLIAAIAGIVLAGCKKKPEEAPVEPTLSVAPVALSFTAAATESFEVVVTTNQSAWDAVSSQSWCIVTKGNGKFTVTAKANTSTSSPAAAVITVTAGNATPVKINVTQSGVGAELSVSSVAPVSFTSAGGTGEAITVTTNQQSWDAVSNQTWCVVSKDGNRFTFTVAANTGAESRIAVITVSAGNAANVTIQVAQAGFGAELSVTPATPVSFTRSGGTSEAITVTTNQTAWDAVSNQTWCVVNKSGNTFMLTASENTGTESRNAVITISAGNAANVTIEVTQAGAGSVAQLTVSPNTGIDFTSVGGTSGIITVTTDQPSWDAVSNQTWCVVNKSGSTFTLTVLANTGTNSRKAVITVSAGSAANVIIEVTQESGVKLTVTPDTPVRFNAGSTYPLWSDPIFVKTNQPSWDAVSSDETWCTLEIWKLEKKTMTKGFPDEEEGFFIIVQPNASSSWREATVTVTAGEATPVIITVTQAGLGAQLSVSPNTSITFSQNGGASDAKTITVTTNQPSWDAVSNQSWCTISKSGNSFTVTASANAGIPRNATITVTAGYMAPITIAVKQEGAEVSVLPKSHIYFTKNGGASETQTITVTTNQPAWDAVSDQSWCTVSKSGNSFTVTASAYTGTSPRNATITVTAGVAVPKTITVTQEGATGILAVGSYYYSDGSYSMALDNSKTCIGVVFSVTGQQSGLVVSLDETERITWATTTAATYATNQINGAANMTIIKARTNWQTTFPTFAWCAAKGDNWYMPAYNELLTLMRSRSVINPKLTAVGGTVIGSGASDFYWSSSENTSNSTWAWFYSTSLETMGSSAKTGFCRVRAIFAF